MGAKRPGAGKIRRKSGPAGAARGRSNEGACIPRRRQRPGTAGRGRAPSPRLPSFAAGVPGRADLRPRPADKGAIATRRSVIPRQVTQQSYHYLVILFRPSRLVPKPHSFCFFRCQFQIPQARARSRSLNAADLLRQVWATQPRRLAPLIACSTLTRRRAWAAFSVRWAGVRAASGRFLLRRGLRWGKLWGGRS